MNWDAISAIGKIIRNIFSQLQGAYIRQMTIGYDPGGLIAMEKVVDEKVRGRGVQEFLGVVDPDWRPEFKIFVDTRLALLVK